MFGKKSFDKWISNVACKKKLSYKIWNRCYWYKNNRTMQMTYVCLLDQLPSTIGIIAFSMTPEPMLIL